MTTKKQLEANRKNCKKSTGPKSAEGKAIVSQNAQKHGILSEKIPLDHEEFLEFKEFYDTMITELEPTTKLESFFADRIITACWRLRRLTHVETLMLKRAMLDGWKEGLYRSAFERSSSHHMAILSRYEKAIENSLYRSINQLQEAKQSNGFVS